LKNPFPNVNFSAHLNKMASDAVEFFIADVEDSDLKFFEDEILCKEQTEFHITNLKPNLALIKAFELKGYKIVGTILYRVYKPFQYAKIHQDTPWSENGLVSTISCLIYLNNLDDGETVFYEDRNAKNGFVSSPCHRGKMVFFDHKIWHSSNPSKEEKRVLLLKLCKI
jgi:hypothetical protein